MFHWKWNGREKKYMLCMRSRRLAKSLLLSLLLTSVLSFPATAAIDRDSGGRDAPLLQEISEYVKFGLKAVAMGDTLSVPKP
jgi:hypothetical protein